MARKLMEKCMQNSMESILKQDDAILRFPQVQALVNLSRSTVWRMEREGRFPAAVVLGTRARGWRRSAIQEFIRNRESVGVSV